MMNKLQRAAIYMGMCLLSCLGCVIIGTALVEHYFGVSRPSATDHSVIGIMMLSALVPEMLVGLILGFVGAAMALRGIKANSRRRRLILLREHRRSQTSPSVSVWPPRPTH